jgi:hypothetical protein
MVVLLLAFGAGQTISTAGNPIIKQKSESEVEIDLGMIVDDFMPPLLELMGMEDEAAPDKAKSLMSLLGVTALDRFHASSSIREGWAKGHMTISLDPEKEGGLLGDLFAVPPSRFRFGRYLDVDEAALVMFSAGMVERIEAINKLLGQPEFREIAPMVPSDPLALTQMWGIDARKQILPLLSGELDLIVFPCAEDDSCEIPKIALVIGLTDGPAFRGTMLDMMENIMGPDKVQELRGVEGESVNGFTFYPMWQNMSYAIARDFGVVTTDSELLKRIVSRETKKSKSEEATFFLHLNGDVLVRTINGIMARHGSDDPELAYVSEIMSAVGEEPIGTLEFKGKTGSGMMEMQFEHPTTLYAAYYRMWKGMMLAAPKMAAMAAKQQGLQGVVHEIDAALTRYGQEHEGSFPESLEELAQAGYLKAMPDLVPTPLGEYVEGGYSYVPLRDDSGNVVGHYFFVYGGDEHGGYDVFTPENLADPSSFRIGKDGEKDGVPNFSYDGVAIEHVEQWNAD